MELHLDWRQMDSAVMPGVRYELRPLRVWAFQELMAFWEQREGAKAAPEAPADLRFSEALALLAVARRVFPQHVQKLEGLVLLKEGQRIPAGVEQLCEEMPLVELAGEILNRLVQLSTLTPNGEKN